MPTGSRGLDLSTCVKGINHSGSSVWASASSAAASTRAFTCRRSAACATPTCSASGARTRRTRRRPPHLRAASTSATAKAVCVDRRHGRRSRHRCHLAHRPNHARVENIEEIVARDRERARARCAASPARSRSRATSPKRSTLLESDEARRDRARLPREPGVRAAGRNRARACCGRAARRRRAVRISRAPPKNTAARTCRGSGAASLQGGGVLNDMMCHSALLVRHLLTKPGAPLSR